MEWEQADESRIAGLRQSLDGLDDVIEDLSRRLMQFKDAQALMSNPRFSRRLRELLREWLEGLLGGTFDEEYVKGRWSLVQRLMDTDLEFCDLILLGSFAREPLLGAVQGAIESPAELQGVAAALEKALCLDLALIHNGFLQIHDDERERVILDRFLAITGFSRTLYENLAETREWSDVSLQRSELA